MDVPTPNQLTRKIELLLEINAETVPLGSYPKYQPIIVRLKTIYKIVDQTAATNEAKLGKMAARLNVLKDEIRKL